MSIGDMAGWCVVGILFYYLMGALVILFFGESIHLTTEETFICCIFFWPLLLIWKIILCFWIGGKALFEVIRNDISDQRVKKGK